MNAMYVACSPILSLVPSENLATREEGGGGNPI